MRYALPPMRTVAFLIASCCCLSAVRAMDSLPCLIPAPAPDIAGLFQGIELAVQAEERLRDAGRPALRGRWLTVRATAYSPHDAVDGSYHATKGERWRWITADGRTDVRREPYGIAVPRLVGGRPAWPYGTRVLIPAGQGYLDQSKPDERIFTVDDSGGAIRGKTERSGILHIDLRFRSEDSARRFAGDQGWRDLRVLVLE